MSFDFHRQQGAIARGQWFSVTHTHFYEQPSDDPGIPEIWCYTDAISYAPGEAVALHVSTSAETYSVEIVRDGHVPNTVFQKKELKGALHATPKRAYAEGCGWPKSLSWKIPEDAASGGYVVCARIITEDGQEIEQQAFFVVRGGKARAPIVLIAATATWTAYNDWGGANSYEGIDGESGDQFSPHLSLKRPWARGQIWLPVGAPRIPHHEMGFGSVPIYPAMNFAFAQGFAKYYAAAGWASYERHFVEWAERENIPFDIVSQHDLHDDSTVLDGYSCAVIVGHDEYWSREMRDHLDQWVEAGGNVARFGGNFIWQIRMENDNQTQVCYKYRSHEEDPVMETDAKHLLTSTWEDKLVNYPGAVSMGLNGYAGVYVSVGAAMPRSQRGFTVYRQDHWVFEGADVYFGDQLGADAGIYGYEVDSVDFNFKNGLPFPTHSDGAPDTLEILAMGPATLVEEDQGNKGSNLYVGAGDAEFAALARCGEINEASIETVRYGAGMIGIFQRGNGEVFNAASCEWIMGLARRDRQTEIVTRNVLSRYGKLTSS